MVIPLYKKFSQRITWTVSSVHTNKYDAFHHTPYEMEWLT